MLWTIVNVRYAVKCFVAICLVGGEQLRFSKECLPGMWHDRVIKDCF